MFSNHETRGGRGSSTSWGDGLFASREAGLSLRMKKGEKMEGKGGTTSILVCSYRYPPSWEGMKKSKAALVIGILDTGV